MCKKQRQEEPGDLIQMPLFDAMLTGRLNQNRLPPQEEAGMGFLKEKARGCEGIGEGLVSCFSRQMFFLRVPGCELGQWVR